MPSERIQFLIKAYFSDTLTTAEMDELAAYVRESGQDDDLLRLLDDVWTHHVPNAKMPERMSERILSNILPVVAAVDESQDRWRKPKSGAYRMNTLRWVAAACVVLALLSFGGFYLAGRKTVKNQVAKTVVSDSMTEKDILPGSQKATLTLSNGSKILLDSAASGALARQGNAQVVKLPDNRISYRAGDDPADIVLYNTMSTPRGGQYQLILSDGTKVWLNSASSIHYPTVFSGRERHVEVTGEAYFEVAKNPVKPFVVKLNDNLSIRVLGTHFNVNSYEDESHIKTTLLEGSIGMVNGKQETSIVPGQQAQVNKNGTLTLLNQVNLEEVTAWKNGYFQFSSTDLSTVMRQISRWYDIDVAYSGKIPDDKFSGKISMTVSLSRVKKWLAWSDIHFTVTGRKMVVSP